MHPYFKDFLKLKNCFKPRMLETLDMSCSILIQSILIRLYFFIEITFQDSPNFDSGFAFVQIFLFLLVPLRVFVSCQSLSLE